MLGRSREAVGCGRRAIVLSDTSRIPRPYITGSEAL